MRQRVMWASEYEGSRLEQLYTEQGNTSRNQQDVSEPWKWALVVVAAGQRRFYFCPVGSKTTFHMACGRLHDERGLVPTR